MKRAAKVAKAADCLIKIGKKETPIPAGLGEKMSKAYQFRQVMEQAKASMDAIHVELEKELAPYMEEAGSGSVHLVYRGVDLTLSKRETLVIDDPDGLRKAVEKAGSRWDDLVKTVISYKPMESLSRLIEERPKLGKFLTSKAGKAAFKYVKEA